LIFLTAVSAAQMGQFGGGLILNVTLGGSNSTTLTIFNSGDAPLNYRIVSPVMSTIVNETTPTITISPMNGTLAPHTQLAIKVNASVSAKDKPGLAWQGLIQTIGVTNATANGGAQIQAGLGKVIFVYSVEPPAPPPTPWGEIISIAAIVIALIAGVAYYFMVFKNRKPMAKAAEKKGRPKSDKERIRELEAELAKAKTAPRGGKKAAKAKARRTAKRAGTAKKTAKRARKK